MLLLLLLLLLHMFADIEIQSNTNMHHYGCVALYEASILQKGRFWAASLASSSSMSNEVRSPLMLTSRCIVKLISQCLVRNLRAVSVCADGWKRCGVYADWNSPLTVDNVTANQWTTDTREPSTAVHRQRRINRLYIHLLQLIERELVHDRHSSCLPVTAADGTPDPTVSVCRDVAWTHGWLLRGQTSSAAVTAAVSRIHTSSRVSLSFADWAKHLQGMWANIGRPLPRQAYYYCCSCARWPRRCRGKYHAMDWRTCRLDNIAVEITGLNVACTNPFNT